MSEDKHTSRRLEYWLAKQSNKHPYLTFTLVPTQTQHDSFYFDEFVEFIKAQGFTYRIIETTEEVKVKG